MLRFHGVRPPRAAGAGGFRYVDLGCGLGLNAVALAAAYPDAEFIGVDASPTHVACGEAVAADADIDNVSFLTARFGAPEIAALAPADYVVANGIYSWIDRAGRDAFRRSVDRLLRPGGAALVSANLAIGWMALTPMQRLFVELGRAAPDAAPEAVVTEAAALAADLVKASRNPVIQAGAEHFAERYSKLAPGYVVHEMLAADWRLLWSSDVAADFETIGLRYLSDAKLNSIRDDICLTEAQRAMLAAAPTPGAALTLRDLFFCYGHGHNILHRPVADAAPDAALAASRFDGWARLEVPADAFEYVCRTKAGTLKFDNGVARRMVAELATGPAPLRRLAEVGGASSDGVFLRILDCLYASEQACPVDPARDGDRTAAVNAVILKHDLSVSRRAAPGGTPRAAPAGRAEDA